MSTDARALLEAVYLAGVRGGADYVAGWLLPPDADQAERDSWRLGAENAARNVIDFGLFADHTTPLGQALRAMRGGEGG